MNTRRESERERKRERERRIVPGQGEAIQPLFTNVFEVINNEIRIAIQRESERGGFLEEGGGSGGG